MSSSGPLYPPASRRVGLALMVCMHVHSAHLRPLLVQGWGKKGMLDLSHIKQLAKRED